MALPDTNTLDIPSRASAALYPYALLGSQSINTQLLDTPSRGSTALYLYNAYKLTTTGALTMLEGKGRGPIATITRLEAGRGGPVALATTLSSTGTLIPPITQLSSTLYSNSGGSLTTPLTVGLYSNQVLVVRYATSTIQGDATSITYAGVPLTRVASQFGAGQDGVSVWLLLSPPVGTADLLVAAAQSGSATSVQVDLFDNVKQTTTVTSATGSGNSSLPNTDTLDLPSRGGPAAYTYQLQGGVTITTAPLDLPTRGLPATYLYTSPTDAQTAALSLTPGSADNWIVDVLAAHSIPTPAQTQDFLSGTAGGSHVVQTGGPNAQTMSWSLTAGGAWQQAAIALEHAGNSGNVLGLNTMLSRLITEPVALQAFLETVRRSAAGLFTLLESAPTNRLFSGPMGLLMGLQYNVPDNLGILTILWKLALLHEPKQGSTQAQLSTPSGSTRSVLSPISSGGTDGGDTI